MCAGSKALISAVEVAARIIDWLANEGDLQLSVAVFVERRDPGRLSLKGFLAGRAP